MGYAASCGYEVDKRESSRASVVMRGPDRAKLVIATKENGHGVYFNVRDSRDSGSIIDFLQVRRGLNLGEVRRELRPWVAPSFSYRPSAGAEKFLRPEPSSPGRQQVCLDLAGMGLAGKHPYLRQRGLSSQTLEDPRFVGAIRIDGRGNAVFPHRDRHGFCGFELKNRIFTGFSRGGEKGLWTSEGLGTAKRLVLVESALDAMSHAQVTRDREAGYVSVGGSLSERQKSLIQGLLIKAHSRGVAVVLGTDRDKAGHELAAEISKLAPKGMRVEREEPRLGKDWNEQLQKQERGHSRGMGFGR